MANKDEVNYIITEIKKSLQVRKLNDAMTCKRLIEIGEKPAAKLNRSILPLKLLHISICIPWTYLLSPF